MKGILKVYPSKFWHDDIVIIGNEEGLLKLKKAIETALSGESGAEVVQETDQCEYAIHVKMHNGDILNEEWLDFPLHYDEEGINITNEEQEFLRKFLVSTKE